ncbi:MAG: phosphotransferase, partial [Anaerolineae bacterium]|nr:phosphotransferase [Anaerolineae bacterium]
SPQWRESVRMFLKRVESEVFADPVAASLATLMKAKRDEIFYLLERAEQLAALLQSRPLEFVLCHSDIHAGNILIDGSAALYIVDWDNPIWAPKERDLMFIGGAQGFAGCTAQEEESRFYRGYGQTQIHSPVLAYYRYERIIQDIAAYCEQLLLTDAGGEDRAQSLRYLMSNFSPDGTIAMARRADCQPERVLYG